MVREPFEIWMKKVNIAIAREVDLHADDLEDWGYRDGYDANMKPTEAAAEALSNAGWE